MDSEMVQAERLSIFQGDAIKREKWRVANFILPASQQKCFMTGYESGLAKIDYNKIGY